MDKDILESTIQEEYERYIDGKDEKYSVQELIKLLDLANKAEERNVNRIKDEDEKDLKLKEMKQQRYLAIVRHGIEVMGIVVPIWFYNRWMNAGLTFEETGTFTSTTFRNLISKFKF